MKWAVANCLNVELKIMNGMYASLLDSGSMVCVMWQDYSNHYFRLQLRPAGLEPEAHNLLELINASSGTITLSRYNELDVKFLGLNIPRMGF